MAKRIAYSQLNASTIDILNVIRANANYEYQSKVPAISKTVDIPRVGEVLYGDPAMLNQFVNALVNRIALVSVKAATFNNAYAALKKGYLEFGETVEEVFIGIAKARAYNPEKAPARELARTLPDVRSAFHAINWRVQYPVTIQRSDLKLAFTSENGMTDLIAKIIGQVLTAAEYDEFLLFKYLLIKAMAKGQIHAVSAGADETSAAIAFRGVSNKMTFMRTEFNESGVTVNTPRENQYIFMSSDFNAAFDVNVLASAFNMEKAEFLGKLYLIDDFNTFDNARFDEIRKECDCIEEVTEDELALMANVKAVLVDAEWFQIYDNENLMTEKEVSSGMYWNYFYNVWKTVSHSPFSNAVAFVGDDANIAPIASFTAKVENVSTSDVATIFVVNPVETVSLAAQTVNFVQSKDATTKGIAIQRYGAVIIPEGQTETTLKATINGVSYTATAAITVGTTEVGTVLTFNKDA